MLNIEQVEQENLSLLYSAFNIAWCSRAFSTAYNRSHVGSRYEVQPPIRLDGTNPNELTMQQLCARSIYGEAPEGPNLGGWCSKGLRYSVQELYRDSKPSYNENLDFNYATFTNPQGIYFDFPFSPFADEYPGLGKYLTGGAGILKSVVVNEAGQIFLVPVCQRHLLGNETLFVCCSHIIFCFYQDLNNSLVSTDCGAGSRGGILFTIGHDVSVVLEQKTHRLHVIVLDCFVKSCCSLLVENIGVCGMAEKLTA